MMSSHFTGLPRPRPSVTWDVTRLATHQSISPIATRPAGVPAAPSGPTTSSLGIVTRTTT